jgi:hypothetical protein
LRINENTVGASGKRVPSQGNRKELCVGHGTTLQVEKGVIVDAQSKAKRIPERGADSGHFAVITGIEKVVGTFKRVVHAAIKQAEHRIPHRDCSNERQVVHFDFTIGDKNFTAWKIKSTLESQCHVRLDPEFFVRRDIRARRNADVCVVDFVALPQQFGEFAELNERRVLSVILVRYAFKSDVNVSQKLDCEASERYGSSGCGAMRGFPIRGRALSFRVAAGARQHRSHRKFVAW